MTGAGSLRTRAGQINRDRLSFATRRRIAFLRVSLRRPTSALRRLPDFLLIGTQRGGTSSLYRYLGAHPQITASLRKETEFLTRRWESGVEWYRGHFPLRVAGRRTFEADPYYLFHPLAAQRAAGLVPDARIVVLLRDPVARAFSHWRHNQRLGVEPLPFAEAIEAEPGRLEGEEERILADPSYDSFAHAMLSYAARGRYAHQLVRWLEHYPPDRLLAVRSEDFYSDTPKVYDEVVSFLGLEPFRPASFANWSYTGGAESRAEPIDPAVAVALRASIGPDVGRLRALLGWEPEWC